MKAITLWVGPEDYERLEAEAVRLGVTPSKLATMYVESALDGSSTVGEKRHQAGLDALDRLAELTWDLPVVDAVQLARDSRADLEERASL
jgi:hypothetical protein